MADFKLLLAFKTCARLTSQIQMLLFLNVRVKDKVLVYTQIPLITSCQSGKKFNLKND